MIGKDRAEELLALVEAARESGEASVPRSALKSFRGSETLRSLEARTGVPSGTLSRIENNDRGMSEELAERIAPAFDMSAPELLLAHNVSALKDGALKGEVSPRKVIEKIERFSENMPDSEFANQLTTALLGILGDTLESYRHEQFTAATKSAATSAGSPASAKPQSTRDGLGRRRQKPHGIEGR